MRSLAKTFLHEASDFSELCRVVAGERSIPVQMVEKDYWLMHVLWGLKDRGYNFELKGGTSLSKGFGLIFRFSEDIDILIQPKQGINLPTGKNQTKPNQILARKNYFDGLASEISIPGIVEVRRDNEFDDVTYKNAGIRLLYSSIESNLPGLEPGILLEAGFDKTAPNQAKQITSWAFERANEVGIDIIDNRALEIPCYLPGYTLVEKLQTISTKFRQEKSSGSKPKNFIRHYYDVYYLLGDPAVKEFIGTQAYRKHKDDKFREAEEKCLTKNEAFLLREAQTFDRYRKIYDASELYYAPKPTFEEILDRISSFLPNL